MCPRWPVPLLYLAATFAPGLGWTQEPRIEQARQIDSLSSTLYRSVDSAPPTSVEPMIGTDADSFGIQQLLRDAERLRPFRVFADVSAFMTNNVALARKDRQSDGFLIATFGFDYRRPLPHGFQLEASLRYTAFRYNEYQQLDFNSVDAGTGVSYHTAKLGGIDFFARYGFNGLISAETDDVFFTNHTILLGVQKLVPFSQAHYAYVGATGQLGFADPKQSERSELSVFAGYHLQVTRKLEGDLLYRYANLHYTEGERADHNQTVSLGFRYRFTRWFFASASAYATRNRSNQEVFDYDAATAGVGLTLELTF